MFRKWFTPQTQNQRTLETPSQIDAPCFCAECQRKVYNVSHYWRKEDAVADTPENISYHRVQSQNTQNEYKQFNIARNNHYATGPARHFTGSEDLYYGAVSNDDDENRFLMPDGYDVRNRAFGSCCNTCCVKPRVPCAPFPKLCGEPIGPIPLLSQNDTVRLWWANGTANCKQNCEPCPTPCKCDRLLLR